jgi:hypothetical protein
MPGQQPGRAIVPAAGAYADDDFDRLAFVESLLVKSRFKRQK